MNALTRITDDENKKGGFSNVLINSMCPGFVTTDMTAVFGGGMYLVLLSTLYLSMFSVSFLSIQIMKYYLLILRFIYYK